MGTKKDSRFGKNNTRNGSEGRDLLFGRADSSSGAPDRTRRTSKNPDLEPEAPSSPETLEAKLDQVLVILRGLVETTSRSSTPDSALTEIALEDFRRQIEALQNLREEQAKLIGEQRGSGPELDRRNKALQQRTEEIVRAVEDLAGQSSDARDFQQETTKAHNQKFDELRTMKEDLDRRMRQNVDGMTANIRLLARWRLWIVAAFLIVASPSFILSGLLAQKEWEIFTPEDPTRGWKDAVWNDYGSAIQDCMLTSRKNGTRVECALTVDFR